MSNSFLRATNPSRVLFNIAVGGYWLSRIHYDISNDLLILANNNTFVYNRNTQVLTYTAINNNNRGTLNTCYYNGFAITIGVKESGTINKTVLYNNNTFSESVFTNSYPGALTTNLVITGCAIYGNTFYVIGSNTANPNTLTVMQTSLTTSNTTNPFNTTTPSFTQTYQTFTAASRIYGNYYGSNKRYTGMCTFDLSGNLYVTTSGSGVYMYPVGSSFASNPSIFISSANYYSTILYNPIFNVFYICNILTNNANSYNNLAIDVYSGYGELIKLNYITGLYSPTAGADNYWPLCFCCDKFGSLYYESSVGAISIIDKYVCFKKDTLILTFQGYKRIQDLKKGDLVKTLKHEYVPIYKIGYSEIHHTCNLEERTKDQLYKCSNTNYPEVFEDLVLTGCHSILVDCFLTKEQEDNSIELNGDLYVTDNKYRLPVCLDERATVYDVPGNHTIYHMALENDDYYMNYGIYANGLLVESTSKRFMDTIKMTLVE